MTSPKAARKFIIQYIAKAHTSIIDPLMVGCEITQPNLSKLALAVLIERQLWEDFKNQIRNPDVDPVHDYCQLVDGIVSMNSYALANR